MYSKTETYNKSIKNEALNCIENLLIREEICVDRYELLTKLLDLLSYDNSFDLGEGMKIKLIDCENES